MNKQYGLKTGDLKVGYLVGVNLRSKYAKVGVVTDVLHNQFNLILSARVLWGDGQTITCEQPRILEVLCK